MDSSRADEHLNLKGFIIGNGVVDYKRDPTVSLIDIGFAFNIVPETFVKVYNDNGCIAYSGFYNHSGPTGICADLINQLL